MRRQASFFILLCIVGFFVLPHAVHAAIPFFGPIIPPKNASCPAGWGMLMIVVNNIISVALTLFIIFYVPWNIAKAGFLFVVNPTSVGNIEKAKGILTSTIVGIVIALSAWMIVAALLAVLMPSNKSPIENWTNLISSDGADSCLNVKDSLSVAVTPPAAPAEKVPSEPAVVCSVQPLPELTDSLAQQMESGSTVIWENTDARLKTCTDKFISKTGGTVTSAYRPQAYQGHLFEIRDRWCTQDLKSNTSSACSSLRKDIAEEVFKHFGLRWDCGAVAQTASSHSSGIGVDISGIDQNISSVKDAAADSCLNWRNYPGDPYHYDLKQNCTCS